MSLLFMILNTNYQSPKRKVKTQRFSVSFVEHPPAWSAVVVLLRLITVLTQAPHHHLPGALGMADKSAVAAKPLLVDD